MKYQFSGHESFICKHFWLKKGYDYKGNFNEEDAVIELGVGKNMVTSIAYWLKAFGLKDVNNDNKELADFLFHSVNGKDPYIENIASLWLLHFSLIKTNKASLYNLFFNYFRKNRVEFTREHIHNFLRRLLEDENLKSFNENTLKADVSVFIRSYLKPTYKETKIDLEEDFSILLMDLDLMQSYETVNDERKIVDWYVVSSKEQAELPWEVVLFAIIDNYENTSSVSFNELLVGINSPGLIFCLNEDGLYNKIESMTRRYKQITYSESAGVRQIQFKSKINKWEVLNGCY